MALYIHFPWCVKKCPYCDFNSHPLSGSIQQDKYIDALLYDLEHMLQLYPMPINSIFMGGGTPSLFAASYMDKLLAAIKYNFTLVPDCEITCEANPGTIDAAQFAGYLDAGINRISIGVQSFNDKHLKLLGRIHNAECALAAIAHAAQVGFQRINIDIMYALPQQDIAAAMQDLKIGCDTAATHISWYQLTYEADTLFARFPPARIDADAIYDLEQQGLAILAANNFSRYEISAFHRPYDIPCQHNLNYWQFGDYHAIGAGAHGKISRNNAIIRYHKEKIPKKYMLTPRAFKQHTVAKSDYLIEYLLNRLRVFAPIDIQATLTITAVDKDKFYNIINELSSLGLVTYDDQCFQPTARGYSMLNSILIKFSEI